MPKIMFKQTILIYNKKHYVAKKRQIKDETRNLPQWEKLFGPPIDQRTGQNLRPHSLQSFCPILRKTARVEGFQQSK